MSSYPRNLSWRNTRCAPAAYEAGDAERLQQILRAWEESPESITGGGIGAVLIRLIRKIAQV